MRDQLESHIFYWPTVGDMNGSKRLELTPSKTTTYNQFLQIAGTPTSSHLFVLILWKTSYKFCKWFQILSHDAWCSQILGRQTPKQ